jgi:hypothetical protein
MFTVLLPRRLRPAHRSGRTQVCPPALLQGSMLGTPGWRAALQSWLSTGWTAPPSDPPDQPQAGHGGIIDPRLGQARDDFLQAVQDIRAPQTGLLQGRVRIARSLRELWHLRPEVFNLVALCVSQAEAQCRLDRLNRHFPTRSPRSGFAPLRP